MTAEGQKVIVDDITDLEAVAESLDLPRKCFIVFSPKEQSIQDLRFNHFCVKEKFYEDCFWCLFKGKFDFRANSKYFVGV